MEAGLQLDITIRVVLIPFWLRILGKMKIDEHEGTFRFLRIEVTFKMSPSWARTLLDVLS